MALPGSTDPDVAMFLDGLGVRPGVEVEVREKHPFDGPLVVSVDGHDRTIGREGGPPDPRPSSHPADRQPQTTDEQKGTV